jgi:HlyD family secretion protein
VKRVWIAIGVVVLLALVVVASIRSNRGKAGVRVYAEGASKRSISQTVKARGAVDPRVKVEISAHVIARIQKLFVKEGQEIQAGQPFLELERSQFEAACDNYKAQMAMARTAVARAEVALADARVRQERNRRLQEQGIVAIERVESTDLEARSAELELQRSKEAVAQADAGYRSALDELGKTTIYAPLSGRVIALNAEEGEVVVSGTMNNPASVIGTIADLSELLAEADVDETEIVAVKVGQSARVDVDAVADHAYHGRVVEIGSSGYSKPSQPDVNFFKVKILLTDPDERLRPGMTTRVEIEVDTHADTLVVPIQAVVERRPLGADGKPLAESVGSTAEDKEIKVVFVVDDKNLAHQRPVEVGLSDTTHVEIASGLAAGDKVVTGPYRSLKDLKDGDRVKIASEKDKGDQKKGDDDAKKED